jgi:cell division protein FtsL
MQEMEHWKSYVLLVVVGLLLVFALVWTRLQVVAVGYALSNTQQLLHTLEGERQALLTEWSARTAPGRLTEQATQRLGLGAPEPEQVVRMR